MTGNRSNARVVIVGAGPVGMVCALSLNKLGVPVTVFEQEPAPVEDQRAASLQAWRSVHSPSGVMTPSSSAIGMNSPGDIRPRRG